MRILKIIGIHSRFFNLHSSTLHSDKSNFGLWMIRFPFLSSIPIHWFSYTIFKYTPYPRCASSNFSCYVVHTQNYCVQNRSCVEIKHVLENFVLQQHKFVLISTQDQFQHKSDFEHKIFKSIGNIKNHHSFLSSFLVYSPQTQHKNWLHCGVSSGNFRLKTSLALFQSIEIIISAILTKANQRRVKKWKPNRINWNI
jgi:hypothetical protein